VLYDRQTDPYMINNLIADKKYKSVAKKLRNEMAGKMKELNDEFMPCSWYRDNWMYKRFSIRAAAKGEFGPLPPLEPERK